MSIRVMLTRSTAFCVTFFSITVSGEGSCWRIMVSKACFFSASDFTKVTVPLNCVVA